MGFQRSAFAIVHKQNIFGWSYCTYIAYKQLWIHTQLCARVIAIAIYKQNIRAILYVYVQAAVEQISNILHKAASNKHELWWGTSEKVGIPDLQYSLQQYLFAILLTVFNCNITLQWTQVTPFWHCDCLNRQFARSALLAGNDNVTLGGARYICCCVSSRSRLQLN